MKKVESSQSGQQSGQSIVLVIVMILCFLLFFGFVINTGVLVTAKISLQTAADAAAYSGAATQARQMNQIAFLNYDLRRQYKKFLFRYAILGNLRDAQFLNKVPQSNGYFDFHIKEYINGSTTLSEFKDMKIPVICLPIVTTTTDSSGATQNVVDGLCSNANLPAPTGPLQTLFANPANSPQIQQLYQNLLNIQKVASTYCQGRGAVNLYTTMAWLFRGSIADDSLTQFFGQNLIAGTGTSGVQLTQQNLQNITNLITSVTDGLGIFPRNLIHLMRIRTLTGFVNEPAKPEVNLEWIGANEREKHERTVMAFRSALSNLNPNTFDPNSLMMNEIINPNPLTLREVKVEFNTYYQNVQDKQGVPNSNANENCVLKVETIPLKGLPVAVVAEKSNVTYGVRLKATAKMFLPTPLTVDLEAVSGAKPFGSRIGPPPGQISEVDFVEPIKPGDVVKDPAIANCESLECKVPNLKILSNPSTTFLSQPFMQALGDLSRVGNEVTNTRLRRALRHAAAPYPSEVGIYSILPPKPDNPDAMRYQFMPYWSPDSVWPPGSDPNANGRWVYRFYAPLFPEGNDNFSQQVNDFLETQGLQAASVVSNLPFNPAELRQLIATQLNAYQSALANPNTAENGESATFAAIELPVQNDVATSSSGFWVIRPNQILNSWAPTAVRTGPGGSAGSFNPPGANFAPRFGFSVKFVNFQNLLSQGLNDSDGELEKVNH